MPGVEPKVSALIASPELIWELQLGQLCHDGGSPLVNEGQWTVVSGQWPVIGDG